MESDSKQPPSRDSGNQGARDPGRKQPLLANRPPTGVKLNVPKLADAIPELEQAARRAQQLEARAAAKRKAGGKIDQNVAVHVDETGQRWARQIRRGLVGCALVVLLILGLLFYRAARLGIPVRGGNEQTRQDLGDLAYFAQHMPPFQPDQTFTAEQAKERLLEAIDAELAAVEKRMDEARAAGGEPVADDLKERERLRRVRTCRNAWGTPFEFSLADPDTLLITGTGKSDGSSPSDLAPVKVRVRK